MKIQVLHHLNEKQAKKAQMLVKACREYEPLTLEPPLTAECGFDEKLPCFYLLYENNELVSFLSLFLPEPYYGEAMGFTHPMARQRGYFSKLWDEALKKLDSYIEDMELLFVTDGNSKDALAALAAMEGEYQYSEYLLEKDCSSLTDALESGDSQEEGQSPSKTPSLTLREAGKEDFSAAVSLHEAIFCDGTTASERMIREMFNSCGCRTFLAQAAGKTVGLFHLKEWDQGTYLSGFGIHPEFQGEGLGKKMLRAATTKLSPGHARLSLQVSSLDEAAFALYKGEGFEERSRRDYYY